MAIPAGITTAFVHMDAPVSFTGDPGKLHVTISSSVPVIWAATGTPLANFTDIISPGDGQPLEVYLPHTDQAGFVDGNGHTFKGWSYVVTTVYEKEGQLVSFPDREFQLLSGQADVDLALVPAGTSYVPVVAPILPVTSLEGFTGAVTKAQLRLERVDNTNDLEKPVSAAAQAALDAVTANANSRILQPADPGADRILFWDDSAKAYVPLAHTAPLNITGTTLSVTPATGAAAGTMSAADKAKLDAAISGDVANAIVRRDASGRANLNSIGLTVAPTNANDATRKDYVDAKVAAVTYGTLGVVPTSSLPPLAINEVFTVASQAAMLALTAERGDMAIRTDTGKTYVLSADAPGTLASWKEVMATGQVVSVAGQTGTVVLAKADVGLGNVDNTSDVNKPVSTAQQTALNAKAPLASPAFTGTPTGITKSHVGLSNVDNTSDANKPVSTAQAAADDKLAKGLVALAEITTASAPSVNQQIVLSIPSFTFQPNRWYEITWTASFTNNTGASGNTLAQIMQAPVADPASATTNLTELMGYNIITTGVGQTVRATIIRKIKFGSATTMQIKGALAGMGTQNMQASAGPTFPSQLSVTDLGMQF